MKFNPNIPNTCSRKTNRPQSATIDNPQQRSSVANIQPSQGYRKKAVFTTKLLYKT